MVQIEDILASRALNLPRYTSYPTAPHFSMPSASALSNQLMLEAAGAEALSIYVHIPFCDRLCWFCGCHTKQTLKYEPVAAYTGFIEREILLAHERMGRRPRLRHLHFGGGSPSMLKLEDFERLRNALERLAIIDTQTEIAVEIDPSDNNPALMQGLRSLGATRCSIGVQDFDPTVQAAINRIQTFEETRQLIGELRNSGINSINIDVLYGLPHQTHERLLATAAKVLALKPDRIALFGYAHVPWLKKHQSMIDDAALPGETERFRHAEAAAQKLVEAGYLRIGLDHFAKPTDSLAIAQRESRLHRNFQGYTTDASKVLLGFGASAISRCSRGLIQSVVPTNQYQQRVSEGQLPHAKGIAFSRDDIIRGWIIERLMCDLQFKLSELQAAFPQEAATCWELALAIAERETGGLVEVSSATFRVPETARGLVRFVASQFDAYLENGSARYSKAV